MVVLVAAVMVGLTTSPTGSPTSTSNVGAPLHPPPSTTREIPAIPEPTVFCVATDSTISDSATDPGTATPPATRTRGAADATRIDVRRIRGDGTHERTTTMSIGKKIAHMAEAAKGAAKKMVGRGTGNTRLRTEGRTDQAKGDTKQAGEKMKDTFKH
ncbi:uncharacterized protein YjbJ (UPF0337 family) [Nocardia sp. GAS34]|uniref:CsbD family protein n=1 Tax=unclassified Nocardia TaxID=2637762 RepID=UPI003D1B50BA